MRIGPPPTNQRRSPVRRRGIGIACSLSIVILILIASIATANAIGPVDILPYIGSYPVTCGWHASCAATPVAGKGLDFSIGGQNGLTIYSAAAGTVHRAGYDTGWGQQVIVRSPVTGGCYYHRYAHLVATNGMFVREGQQIGQGSPIGYADNSGASTGPHLHFHVYYTTTCSLPYTSLNESISVYAATSTEPLRGYNSDGTLRASYYYANFPPAFQQSTGNYENYSFPGTTKVTDDGDPLFSTTGSWTTQVVGFDRTHMNNRDMRWVSNTFSGATASASWRGGIATQGFYRLYAFIPSNYATTTRARYRITYYRPSTGSYVTSDVYINQNVYYNQWVSLGTYCGTSSDYPRVTLYNDTGETTGTTRVGADAMMWVLISSTCPSTGLSVSSEVAGRPGQEDVAFETQATHTSTLRLTAEPPDDVAWRGYSGRFGMKNIAFAYQFLYPSQWFIYTDPSGDVHIQSFPRVETCDQLPPDFGEGFAKVEISVSPCTDSSFHCRLTGKPITIAGLSGNVRTSYDKTFDTTVHDIALQKGAAIFRITAFIAGHPERAANYESIIGYMLSTLTFDE